MLPSFLCLGCLVTQVLLPGAPRACVLCGFNALKDLFWPDDDAHPDDPETAKKKKEAKKKPHPPLDDCPGLCLQRHLFDVGIWVDRFPSPGQPLALVARYAPLYPAGIDESLVPEQLRPDTATLVWTILEGADLATFAGGETAVSGTNSTHTNVMLHFGKKAQGEVRVQLSFRYRGLLDVPIRREMTLPVGLKRDPGEREASETSKFRVARHAWKSNPYESMVGPDADDLARVYLAWDFAVGSAMLTDATNTKLALPHGFLSRFSAPIGRAGTEFERPHPDDPLSVAVCRRYVFVRAFTDAIGEDVPDDVLRDGRRSAFLQHLEDLAPKAARDFIEFDQLTAVERGAVLAHGLYPATNATADGRAKNRSLLFFEILRWESDRKKSGRERDAERYGDWIDPDRFSDLCAGFMVPPEFTGPGASRAYAALDRSLRGQHSLAAHVRGVIRDYLAEGQERGLRDFANRKTDASKDSDFAYFLPTTVDRYDLYRTDIREHRRMAHTRLIEAFLEAEAGATRAEQQAIFDRGAYQLWDEVVSGQQRLDLKAMAVESAAVVVAHHLGKLIVHSKTKHAAGRGIYGTLSKTDICDVPVRVVRPGAKGQACTCSLKGLEPGPCKQHYEDDDLPWPCG
ncbi:MAG: hypothetical protein M9894_06880 [Planctomycetes bacterium]|nr:hypothetical protein [Planctomycetota bacterium]